MEKNIKKTENRKNIISKIWYGNMLWKVSWESGNNPHEDKRSSKKDIKPGMSYGWNFNQLEILE